MSIASIGQGAAGGVKEAVHHAESVKSASPTTSVTKTALSSTGGGGLGKSDWSPQSIWGGSSKSTSSPSSSSVASVGRKAADSGTRGNDAAIAESQKSGISHGTIASSVDDNPIGAVYSGQNAGRGLATLRASKADPVGDRPAWLQLQDQLDTLTPAHRSGHDPVGDRPAWLQLQDQLDTLTPGVARGSGIAGAHDVTGDIMPDWNEFQKNVRNGSLGSPRGAGYGLDGAPAGATDPLTAAHEFLQAPYERRVEANGGAAPFEGPVDWGGIGSGIYQFLQAPHNRRVLHDAVDTTGPLLPTDHAVQTTPVPAPARDSGWADAWSRLISDRLPSEPQRTDLQPPAYVEDPNTIARTLLPDGSYSEPLTAIADATSMSPLPRRDPRAGQPITIHGGDVASSDYGDPGLVTGTRGGPTGHPSTWDTVVDNTGKLLSHTGLGGLVSTLFPDLWSGMGDAFKGMDNGTGVKTKHPEDMAYALSRLYGDPHSGGGGGGGTAPTPPPPPPPGPAPFPDGNHNGIDDRLEVPGSISQFASKRPVVFPKIPPYNPGVDDEWLYFRDHLARGGVVGYADGGEVDPRVMMIADAEDALHRGDHAHPSLDKFVDAFGPKALENLHTNVRAGFKMRPGRARQIVGPGGPTDDAVPAIIDGRHPAKLSSGEVVMPVSAVEGAGDGDPRVGAQRLQELSARLAAK